MKKKGLLGCCLFLLLSIPAAYILIPVFIPARLSVSTHFVLKCNAAGAFRTLSEDSFWRSFRRIYGEEQAYRITGKYYNAVSLKSARNNDKDRNVDKDDDMPESRITIFPVLNLDSIALEWSCSMSSGSGPFKRIMRYREARAVKKRMGKTLALLRAFLEKKQNVYGIAIEDAMSPDSTLVATRLFSPAYPSTTEIYRMVSTLRNYIASQDAKETDYPMLHVKDHSKEINEGPGRFETMVAIPANKRLPGNRKVFLQLFVPYKILIGETRGGPATGEHALIQLQQYQHDYQRTAMAIPFQQLVTERDQEPDTAKWITRVILPVD